MIEIKFDEQGLVPVIIQDYYSKEVLTLAYMNAESLEISMKEGKTCFYSRSRKELWRKGETSGNFQYIVSIHADCDKDALVIEVIKDGPACHTGTESCFYNLLYQSDSVRKFSFDALYALLTDRNKTRPEGSYTTYLFKEGLDKILKKIGEESTEVIIGAKNSRKELVYEICDLAYHTMVLMVHQGITIKEIKDELALRHVVDHKDKQKKMG